MAGFRKGTLLTTMDKEYFKGKIITSNKWMQKYRFRLAVIDPLPELVKQYLKDIQEVYEFFKDDKNFGPKMRKQYARALKELKKFVEAHT